MKLQELGYNQKIEELIKGQSFEDFELGRVTSEHKERYVVQTESNSFNAEITGSLRFSAESRTDFPTVGDWVKLSVFDEMAIITEILPRFSLLERQAVGKFGETQPIASNVDVAFIMQAVGHDFNLNRLERYLTICNASSIEAIIILSKTDLIDEDKLSDLISKIKDRLPKIYVFPISNETMNGYKQLSDSIQTGKTYCILGSSGVGKSSLTNNLLQTSKMEVNEISQSTAKGKHTTSHRELMILPNGGVIIDTPGMRELGVASESGGVEETFEQIHELSEHCRFRDCSHIEEQGCAVLEALENDELDQEAFNNYHKLRREQAHFSRSVHERRAKDKKMGKLYKSIIQEKQKRKK
ncbi:MAG: ribosome small subunit-dependent GTPase A [Balneolaceae bacterium]|nr:ribosome small subunit-dependent GTPase A [Balneolaceae bacterium]MBO6546078.1 ribosome small subunit-dependent GTPase A [Balneolaceae bacterium]MBO6647474.1 ribosome small subunit-dependent GTPase A [Balneolaceae bacterium]